MKKLWDDRRMFLALVAMVGLLHIMDVQKKDYSFEILGLALGIGGLNAWEKVKGKAGKDDGKPESTPNQS